MSIAQSTLERRCDDLRSLHVPGKPLVLPNVWDVASARAVAAAGFPAVATTSAGVAAVLGHDDHEAAPCEEMFAAAARITRNVDVPVTIDAEAGYGIAPEDLVATLERVGAAGCNLEDTDHTTGTLRDPGQHAAWLHRVRDAASKAGYRLVINARIDVFLAAYGRGPQSALVAEALQRARLYRKAGADCVYPIALWEEDAVAAFISDEPGPVNILALPKGPCLAELTRLGVARISYASLLYRNAVERFSKSLTSLAERVGVSPRAQSA